METHQDYLRWVESPDGNEDKDKKDKYKVIKESTDNEKDWGLSLSSESTSEESLSSELSLIWYTTSSSWTCSSSVLVSILSSLTSYFA